MSVCLMLVLKMVNSNSSFTANGVTYGWLSMLISYVLEG